MEVRAREVEVAEVEVREAMVLVTDQVMDQDMVLVVI